MTINDCVCGKPGGSCDGSCSPVTQSIGHKHSSCDFDNWANELKEKEQPTCNIEDAEDCEACGS